jgi:hypothetical protein
MSIASSKLHDRELPELKTLGGFPIHVTHVNLEYEHIWTHWKQIGLVLAEVLV